MKSIAHRLCKLENRFVPRSCKDDQPSPAELIRDSRRRRYAAAGLPFVEPPSFDTTGMSRAEIIRQSRMRHQQWMSTTAAE